MPTATLDHCLLRINSSHIALAGGRSFDEDALNDWIESRDFYLMDLTRGVWRSMDNMTVVRNNQGCGLVYSESKGLDIVVAGK